MYALVFSVVAAMSVAPSLAQAQAQQPEAPAFVRDTHLIENGEYTRPFQPAIHTSRDGRIGLRPEAVVSFNLFTPEKLNEPFTVSAPGIDNVYGNTFRINQNDMRAGIAGAFRHIALCEAPPSDANPINPKVCNGNDDCYDLTVIAATRPATEQIQFVGIDVRVRVENPKTPQATIADITYEAPVLGTVFDGFKDFFETTTPADGRLIVGRNAGSRLDWVDDNGNARSTGTDAVYLVNDNPDRFAPCDVRQFDKAYPLSYAPYDATINNRYGFAAHPFRDASGVLIPDDRSLGSYPWIDRDADNISTTTVGADFFDRSGSPAYPARCPQQVIEAYGSCLSDNASDLNSALLQGRIIMGLWTQGKAVFMDNLINNLDFGLGVSERRHREAQLYKATPDHDGWVRIGGGRRGSGEGGPRPRGSGNANFIDSLEHRFNMFENFKPVTPADVPWIVSKGVVSDELVFDDLSNPDVFINSSMVPATYYRGRFTRVGNRSGVHQVANNSTALPDRWSVPDMGRVSNGRVERVSNGGISGRGLWLNDDTSVEYRIPSNERNVDGTPWYASIFFDRRFDGGRNTSRRLITFSDGSSVRVRGDGGLQFMDTTGRLIKEMNPNGPTQNRARKNRSTDGKGWTHIGLDIARGNQAVRVYFNGFYWDRIDSAEPIFRMGEGNLYLGATPQDPADSFVGWIDDFKVLALGNHPEVLSEGISPELACNHAKGTLIGTPNSGGWNLVANSYPAGHFRIRERVQAAGIPTNEHYACYHDYNGDYIAHMQNIPAGHRSVREAINFPEGPLIYGKPRPDSSNNAFCLSCHTGDGRFGMHTSALTLNSRVNAEDDPRRQPTQPDAKVSGYIPANWLGINKPASAIRTGPTGEKIDKWLLDEPSLVAQASVITPEPVVITQPVITPEPVVLPQPVIAPEPAVTPEPEMIVVTAPVANPVETMSPGTTTSVDSTSSVIDQGVVDNTTLTSQAPEATPIVEPVEATELTSNPFATVSSGTTTSPEAPSSSASGVITTGAGSVMLYLLLVHGFLNRILRSGRKQDLAG